MTSESNEPLFNAVPSVREVDGRLVIDWPDPRPSSFEITAEAFELLIARANHE
jgi:hypothetical protein